MSSLRVIGLGVWAVMIVVGLLVAGVEVRNAIRRLDNPDA